MDLSIRQAAYRSQLTALLPTGRAWAIESDPALADFIAALALELARIEQRATELLAVSTHSHPKVAAPNSSSSHGSCVFQHTATRRWLRRGRY